MTSRNLTMSDKPYTVSSDPNNLTTVMLGLVRNYDSTKLSELVPKYAEIYGTRFTDRLRDFIPIALTQYAANKRLYANADGALYATITWLVDYDTSNKNYTSFMLKASQMGNEQLYTYLEKHNTNMKGMFFIILDLINREKYDHVLDVVFKYRNFLDDSYDEIIQALEYDKHKAIVVDLIEKVKDIQLNARY